MSKFNIRDKSNYIYTLIKKQGKLYDSDILAYKYVYDIVSFLVHRKLININLPSDFPEEIVQNVVTDFFIKFSSNNNIRNSNKNYNEEYIKKHNKEVDTILPYLSFCVMSEFSKLSRNKYKGQTWISSGYNLDLDFDETGEFSQDPFSEVYMFLSYFDEIKVIINELVNLINDLTIPVKNKKLLLFPLLLAIIRENDKSLVRYNKRVSYSLKLIYREMGNLTERLKK